MRRQRGSSSGASDRGRWPADGQCGACDGKKRSGTGNTYIAKPKALKPGDCIGILGPATLAGDTDFSKAVELLHKLGYRTKDGAFGYGDLGLFCRHGQPAGGGYQSFLCG